MSKINNQLALLEEMKGLLKKMNKLRVTEDAPKKDKQYERWKAYYNYVEKTAVLFIAKERGVKCSKETRFKELDKLKKKLETKYGEEWTEMLSNIAFMMMKDKNLKEKQHE